MDGHTPRPAAIVRAFTLIELLVVIAIIALLVSILLPALSSARETGRKVYCASNQKQLVIAALNYSTDERDRIPSFTWEANFNYGPGTFTPVAGHTQASAAQAIDILRRRAGRTDLTPPANWIPNVLYTHLVLNDYLAQRLPEPAMACPNDRKRLLWQEAVRGKNPAQAAQAFLAISTADRPPGTGNDVQRWPYSSSYQFVPAAWAPDQNFRLAGVAGIVNTVDQNGLGHGFFNIPTAYTGKFYGNRMLSHVEHPSRKVMAYDSHDRHSTKRRQLFFMYAEARNQMLFFDGSVRDLKTGDGNRGFRPRDPLNPQPSFITYQPQTWEPPNRLGTFTADPVVGYYRWTRAGLRGVDFGGNEVPGRTP
ncbi:MAG: type II secretion system protein [Phycisphaeraceae bacterium]|nr:type II secretion system protein [Phycisphaeraceae bacterium]